jgi:MFS family permease
MRPAEMAVSDPTPPSAGRASQPGPAARFVRGLWWRQLDHYPDNGPRAGYLAIVVLTSITLYYQLYVQYSVATSIIREYNMTFTFFVYVTVVAGVTGAFASLVAGLADRWGRANLVVYGLLVTALITLVGLPNAPDKATYMVLYAGLSFIEGMVLVATPALIRDFSPQLGRASAMGFWTLGPILGSLVVTLVSSNTLTSDAAWRTQFHYAGYAGIGAFLLAFVGLRELSPQLRDQLMVSLRDRALIEARAQGFDIDKALERPWRQMLRLDIVGPAFGISIFLVLYFAAVGYLVVFFATTYSANYTQSRANSLGNWYWATEAVTLVVVGLLSDWTRVRKPFMIVGAVGTVVVTSLLAVSTTSEGLGYYSWAILFAFVGFFGGMTFAPWMASFTETAEKHNPAAIATGLAIWGWIIRIVLAVSSLCLPLVVSSVTPLADHGPQVQALAQKYDEQIKTVRAIDPATLAILSADPTNGRAIAKATSEIVQARQVNQVTAFGQLVAVSRVPKADLQYLLDHGPTVQQAQKDAPDEWQTWWWICVGCQIAFIPFIFVMTGRWSPRKAREDAELHDRLVAEELAKLGPTGLPVPAAATPAAAAPAPATPAPAETRGSEPNTATPAPVVEQER